MSERLVFNKTLGIILLVVLFAIITMVYLLPIYDISDKIDEKSDLLSSSEIDTDSDMNYFPGLYISESDGDLEIIRKIFGTFNPNYAHYKSEEFSSGSSKDYIVKFQEFEIESKDTIDADDIVPIIEEQMEKWALRYNKYDLKCPNGIEKYTGNMNYSGAHDCWDTFYEDVEYHTGADKDFNKYYCKVHIDKQELNGDKTIRIMWYLRNLDANSDFYELYPLITIC